jgi:hypothetical protein
MRADKQTAVEWLVEQIFNDIDLKDLILKLAIQQAKEMEREQLIEFYQDGQFSANYPYGLTGEAYYEQEYGNKH